MTNCLTGLAFTKEALEKLKNFSTAQLELSRELLEAKPLGICKITTYVDPKFAFKSLVLTRDVGLKTTRTVTIFTSEELSQTSLFQNKHRSNP